MESSSPRHQRKAVNISEPFAVSVPLRVSAVISSNSTPCGAHVKDKTTAAAGVSLIKPGPGEASGSSSGSSSLLQLETDASSWRGKLAVGDVPELTSTDPNERPAQDGREGKDLSKLECSGKHVTSSPGKLDKGSSPSMRELWSDLNHELKITEPELELLDKTFKPIFCPEGSDDISSKSSSQSSSEDLKTKSGRGGQSRRSCSSPTLSVFHGGSRASTAALTDLRASSGPNRVRKQASESDILHPFYQNMDFVTPSEAKQEPLAEVQKAAASSKCLVDRRRTSSEGGQKPLAQILSTGVSSICLEDRPSTSSEGGQKSLTQIQRAGISSIRLEDRPRASSEGGQKPLTQIQGAGLSSIRLEDRPKTLVFHHPDEDEVCVAHSEELDLVESWDELSSGSRQWVTSPLHTPEIEDMLSPPSSTLSSVDGGGEGAGGGASSHPLNMTVPCPADERTPSGTYVSQGRGNANEPEEPKVPHFQMFLPRMNGTALNTAAPQAGKGSLAIKTKNGSGSTNPPFQRFRRQMSQETGPSSSIGKEEGSVAKHARPCSLNLDLVGRRCIRDISNQQQSRHLQEPTACQQGLLPQRGPLPPHRPVDNGTPEALELELFLTDGHAPLRRNSAPVSVSSVRTAFMIKTSQAKGVPVIPPKVQYTQIPHLRQDSEVRGAVREQENQSPKRTNTQEQTPVLAPPTTQTTAATVATGAAGVAGAATAAVALKKKEELENKKPVLRHQKHALAEKPLELPLEAKKGPTPDPEPQVTMRKPAVAQTAPPTDADVFLDCPHPNRPNILQRPSFRNRQRPQSLILLSPPFPIMDYPPLDDSKLVLTAKRSLNDTTSLARREEAVAGVNLRKAPADGKGLQNKMTIPKSGQRLETSTSCFYQPQRRSMIFESRTQRQIE
ncbi:hypothetical protein CRUP_028685 [Coryphaenoides rupestris]|nr:hypothetical protein CRUP_028685 [Coryphaenoides rupestris]